MFFLVTLYIQTILHFSPVRAGLAFLPMPIVLAIMSTQIPKLVARFGFKRFLVIGPIFVGLGLAWLTRLPVHGDYFVSILPALLLIPLGMGVTFMPLIAAATSGVPGREAGLASGLITTSQQMGGALGLAVLSGVAASVTASAVHLDATRALVHGFDVALAVGLLFVVFAVILAVTIIREPKAQGDAISKDDVKQRAARLRAIVTES
jgi:MFS family permease